jgi:NADH:ubiquinone oxidoreductase subunit E
MRERIKNLEEFRALQDKFIQARSHEKRKVLVCCGTGCAAGGNLAVYEELKTQMEAHGAAYELSLNEGCGGDATGTNEHKPSSDDGLFTLEIVSCLGACGLSPVVMVNDTVHAAMTPEKARALVEQLREEA